MADLRLNVRLNVANEGAKREVREVEQRVDRLRQNARTAGREVARASAQARLPSGGAARFADIRRATTGMSFDRLARQTEAISRVTGHPAAGVLGAVPGGGIIGQVGGLLNPYAIGTLAVTVGVMALQRGFEQQERAQKLGFDQRYSRMAAYDTFLNSTVGPVARSFTRLGRYILQPFIGSDAGSAELRADRFIRQLIDPSGIEIESAEIAEAGVEAARTAQEELQSRTRAALKLPIRRVGSLVALDNIIKDNARAFGGQQGRIFAENLRQSQADWLKPSDVGNEYARRVLQ